MTVKIHKPIPTATGGRHNSKNAYAIDVAIEPHSVAHLRHASAHLVHSASPMLAHDSAHALQISAHSPQMWAWCAEARAIKFTHVPQISAQSIKSWICFASTCLPPFARQCASVSKQMRWQSEQVVMHWDID